MVHVRIDLQWIGHGPGTPCPSFWNDRKHTMRLGFEPVHDWFNEARDWARRTWGKHEASITNIVLTDILGEEI